jgi:ribonuclease HI
MVTSLTYIAKRTDVADHRQRAALSTLCGLPLPMILALTDGLAKGGTRDGCAGIVLEGLGLRRAFHAAAGNHTSSFRAECVALVRCLKTVRNDFLSLTDLVKPVEIRICTDSLSALQAFESSPSGQRHVICQKM